MQVWERLCISVQRRFITSEKPVTKDTERVIKDNCSTRLKIRLYKKIDKEEIMSIKKKWLLREISKRFNLSLTLFRISFDFLNPVIYCWRIKALRDRVMENCHRICNCLFHLFRSPAQNEITGDISLDPKTFPTARSKERRYLN